MPLAAVFRDTGRSRSLTAKWGFLCAVAIGGCSNAVSPVGSSKPSAPPAVIAHRGASAVAPENTVFSFDAALDAGADYSEFDVRMTRDGVLVILHDESLDRTARGGTGCIGHLHERLYSEIAGCDVGSYFNRDHPGFDRAEFVGAQIPRLDQVLSRYRGRHGLYLEIKEPELYPGIIPKIVTAIEVSGVLSFRPRSREPIFIQSFYPSALQEVHRLNPDIPLIYLQGGPIEGGVGKFLDTMVGYAAGVAPLASIVTREFVEESHARCLRVHAWTVNSADQLQMLLSLGIDGVHTDDPEHIVREIRRNGSTVNAIC